MVVIASLISLIALIQVLDHGRVKEFDHPHILLQDKAGLFYAMVEHTGRQSAERLASIARHCYYNSLEDVAQTLYDNAAEVSQVKPDNLAEDTDMSTANTDCTTVP